jgi:hypothetical protein
MPYPTSVLLNASRFALPPTSCLSRLRLTVPA